MRREARRRTAWLATAAVACALAGPAGAAEDPRAVAQARVKELFAAGQYAEAVAPAREVVRLTEALAPDHPDLTRALNNLGSLQLRSGDVAGAEASYRRSLELVEATRGIASPLLVTPLVGLGSTYAAQNQHARAAVEFRRALSVSRRVDGLFNLKQLDILEPLITSLVAGGDTGAAEFERMYAVRIVQQQYGARDPRTLPMLARLAAWFEQTAQYARQRAVEGEAWQIASGIGDGRNAAAIEALIGIARSHRLQYAYDPASLMETTQMVVTPDGRIQTAADPMQQVVLVPANAKIDREGERALLEAQRILASLREPPVALRTRVLLELGDWYMTVRRPEEAMPYYLQAWALLPQTVLDEKGNALLAPRQLLYRAPPGAERNRNRPLSEVNVTRVEFAFTVTAEGRVTDLREVANDVSSEVRVTRTRKALEDAVYSPRFEDGRPVATPDVRLVQTFYEVRAGDDRKDDAPSDEEPAAGR